MRNSSVPKDFKRIVSDPTSPTKIVLMCGNRLERCELVAYYEVDPHNPDFVRQVFDLKSE